MRCPECKADKVCTKCEKAIKDMESKLACKDCAKATNGTCEKCAAAMKDAKCKNCAAEKLILAHVYCCGKCEKADKKECAKCTEQREKVAKAFPECKTCAAEKADKGENAEKKK